jgi:hypothetical protein
MSTIRDTQWDVRITDVLDGGASFISIQQHQITLASTSALLLAAANFTSAFFSVTPYLYVIGSLFSNQAGTFILQQSQDGVLIDAEETIAYPGGSVPRGFKFPVVAGFARLNYTNGAVNQATFRLTAKGQFAKLVKV